MTMMGQVKSAGPRLPLVVVTGSTGSGKSKLGIEIAQRFSGEIISADSMQVYKGLDIITNKVTPEEMAQAKHHMIDFVDPASSNYKVVDFCNQALPIVKNLYKQNSLPLIVGGTSYYIESLMYDVLINPEKCKNDPTANSKLKRPANDNCEHSVNKIIKTDNFYSPTEANGISKSLNNNVEYSVEESIGSNTSDTTSDVCCNGKTNGDEMKYKDLGLVDSENSFHLPSEMLHKCLQEIDPIRADELHPMDKRKIIRSIQVSPNFNIMHNCHCQSVRFFRLRSEF